MPTSYATFDEIFSRLASAREWFESIGISTAGSRLEQLQGVVDDLIKDLSELPPEDVVAKWGEKETYWALSDARAFCEIAEQFRALPSHLLPRRKLGIILTGPLDPLQEDPADASVQARNTLAELELASEFSEKGLAPTGFDDLRVGFEGRDLWFECKRIHSPKQVSDHIAKATTQLSRTMLDAESRGLVVVYLDRVTGVDRLVLRVEREGDSELEVRKLVDDFLKQHSAAFQNKSEKRIIGVVLVVRFLVYSTTRKMVSTSSTLALIPWDIAEKRDRELLERFASHLLLNAPRRDFPRHGPDA